MHEKLSNQEMQSSSKILLNTIYIYIGVIITTIISLVTIPVLLRNLGASDYGLYNLVAGVITMLSFVKSSMIVTIQRYMNVAYGANDTGRVNKVFTVSFALYIVVAIITSFIIELLGPFISNGYLNIEPNRIHAAIMLFQVLVISVFFTTISIPYDALFNVYEDMWIFSIFNTLEALSRLVLAIVVGYMISYDKLVVYAVGMAGIAVIVFLLKLMACRIKYKEIKFSKLVSSDWSIVKEIFSFIGWNLYGTLARLFSTEGFAIVLNLFTGTTINAAYGISNQVNSCLNHFTSSVEKAFNPQIMKSEGMNNRSRVIRMSLLSTKYCALIYSLFAIPLIVTLPYVLTLWLKTPPEHTIAFTRIVIIASMVSMLNMGVSSIFYAIGKIKNYLLWLGTLLISVVFVGYGLLKFGVSVEGVIGLFILLEIVLMMVRLYYAKQLTDLHLRDYYSIVLSPYIKVAIPTLLIVVLLPYNGFFIFLGTCFVSAMLYIALMYNFGFDSEERERVRTIINGLFKHKIK